MLTNKKIIFIFLIILIAIFLIGYGIGGNGGKDREASEDLHEGLGHTSKIEEWTCSMHPQIRSPEPGDCPICGMDLIPVTSEDSKAENPREIKLSQNAIQLAQHDQRMLLLSLNKLTKVGEKFIIGLSDC